MLKLFLTSQIENYHSYQFILYLIFVGQQNFSESIKRQSLQFSSDHIYHHAANLQENGTKKGAIHSRELTEGSV